MSAAPRIILTGDTIDPVVKIRSIADLKPIWDIDASIEWLIQDVIPRGSVTLISAESGTGKTWLAYAIAGAVACGNDFAGLKVSVAIPVLYVDGENPVVVVQRDLHDLGIGRTDHLHIWGGWSDSPPPGPNDECIQQFARETKGLIIFDSLVQFHTGDEQSSTETRRFMNYFRELANLGATVIVLHHTGKSGTSKVYRGSSDIQASVDTAYVVTGHPRNGKLHRLNVNHFKSRIAPGQDFEFEFEQGRGFRSNATVNRPALPDVQAQLEQMVRENPGQSATAIIRIAKERCLHAGKEKIRDLLREGPYEAVAGPRNATLYYPRDPPPAPAVELPSFRIPDIEEGRNV